MRHGMVAAPEKLYNRECTKVTTASFEVLMAFRQIRNISATSFEGGTLISALSASTFPNHVGFSFQSSR